MNAPLKRIPIAKPLVGQAERDAVLRVLDSGKLVQGAHVAAFERQFAAYHGAQHGVATSSGTTALMAALMAHEIGPGDEVIVPAFTFFATAASVLSVGAAVVFADIDPDTYCLCPASAEQAITPRTRAIIPVHLYGHPADLPRFEALCDRRGLTLIEDAAQAHGAAIGSRQIGSFGTTAFSFHPSKNMTTTEGGMVLTQSDEVARRLRLIRNQGMSERYHHEILGLNLRMTELCAAIGIEQLARLSEWNQIRQNNARRFDAELRGVSTPKVKNGMTHAVHQYTVRVPQGMDRDAAVARLDTRGIDARIYYPQPLYDQPVFRQREPRVQADLPVTARAAKEVLSLPVHPQLTPRELDYIIAEVNAL